MSDLILYGPAGAPYVRKVRAALVLKGEGSILVEPRGPEDYRRWSPETGLLPVLGVGSRRIADSARILDWLEERRPEPPLVSPDAVAAQQQRRLERWVEDTLHFYWENSLRHQEARSGGRGETLAAEFARRLDDLVNFLGRRPFFYGDAVSRADLAVFGFLGNLRHTTSPGVAAQVESRASLRDHVERVSELVRERDWPPARPFEEVEAQPGARQP
jgi:glutathione S-transferase